MKTPSAKDEILALLADGKARTVAAIAERTGIPVKRIDNSARGLADRGTLEDLKHVPHVNADTIAGLVVHDQLKRVAKGKIQTLYISDRKKNIERCAIWDAATRVAVQRRMTA